MYDMHTYAAYTHTYILRPWLDAPSAASDSLYAAEGAALCGIKVIT